MTVNEIRESFIAFFKEKGHVEVPSSSLVPEGDPSVLFTTAGMQQFKPYYSHPEDAEKDFGGKNVVTVQKCMRTGDIEEVGDDTHLTFFEMLGNFSFGGYGRREAITYAHEYITQTLGLKISYVTIYKGEGVVPRDTESETIWKEFGVDVREDGKDVFWGPTGGSGPCGPTTEIYCTNANGEDVEIWNIVFNEYFCSGSREMLDRGEAELTKLETLGIDTGMGLERLASIVQSTKSVFDIDSMQGNTKEERIVFDHVRTALFALSDGVTPGTVGRNYIVRRLIRRAVRYSNDTLTLIAEGIIATYPILREKKEELLSEIAQEEEKFRKTLEKGLKEFEKGADPFILATTYGFPIELTQELARERGMEINMEKFQKDMEEHQDKSRTAGAGMFKGGLADHDEKTVKLHTAHHLLLAALKQVLGDSVVQKGSNITQERLRIDFAFDRKMTPEEKEEVEKIVNEKIQEGIAVEQKEMPKEEAEQLGAEQEFGAKYGDVVSVYFIGDFSKEFCGGPHVGNTSELGMFRIKKEESSSQGVRRIKAVLE